MKKIMIISALTCSLINNSTSGMLFKCTAMSKKNVFQIKKCNHRTQFNFAEILQQLKNQNVHSEKEILSRNQQIELIEMLITKQPKKPIEEDIATHWKIEDRDFGNMNK